MSRRAPLCALVDLDDTVYPREAGVMQRVSRRIDEFMLLRLGLDEARVHELRRGYYERYGTSMRGLQLDFGINPEDYLNYVHDISVDGLLGPNRQLKRVLAKLPWRKVIFTNASFEHAQRVLDALGVSGSFERIIDVRATGYIGKPEPLAFRRALVSLGLEASDCVVLDDSLANLRTAGELGMITVWVGSKARVEGVDFAIDCLESIGDVACKVGARQSSGEHRLGEVPVWTPN